MTDGVMEFIGQAGFLLEQGGVRLVSDPWIVGDAFAHGWRHLADPVAPDWSTVTHIWFSHEHPDHFSPATLAAIPPDDRAHIAALFQRTTDKKVVHYLRAQGFAHVREVGPDEAADLGAMTMRVMPTGYSDSAALLTGAEHAVLNLNDCVLTPYYYDRIDQLVAAGGAAPDVVMMQYSYAQFVGNRAETEVRRRAAEEKLTALLATVARYQPRWVIPFASFVWFAHEENSHFNETANTIDTVVDAIRAQGIAEPIVLYPGDRWRIGDVHDSHERVRRYLTDAAARRAEPPFAHSEHVPVPEIAAAAQGYWKGLEQIHGRLPLRVLERVGQIDPIVFRLRDHGRSVRFHRGQLCETSDAPDLELSSDALLRFFDAMWGPTTITISGRFESLSPNGFRLMEQQARIGSLANQHRPVHAAAIEAARRRVRDRFARRR